NAAEEHEHGPRPKHQSAVDKVLARIPFGVVLRDAAVQWSDHNDARLGAALAYYSVFSMGPLIVIAIAVAGLIFGASSARTQVLESLQGLIGRGGSEAVDMMLTAASKPREGIIAAAMGVATLLLAAIGVVTQLKDGLNTVWETKPKK